MNLPIFALILLGLGCLISLVGGIMVLVAAFRQSFGWGMVALLIPAGNLVFTCVHWAGAKKGFLTSLAGMALCIGGVVALPGIRVGLTNGNPLALLAPPPPAAAAPDFTAQIAEKRGQLEARNAAFAQDGAELARQFTALETRRKTLKAGDAAGLAKFNADAAAYQTRTTSRKQMFAEIETGQRELDALLAKRSLAAAQGGGSAGGRAVVMYTTSSCPACTSAKQYFAKKGVSYQEINVETSPAGREAFQRLGGSGVPLIMVGNKRVEGFSSQALDALL